MTALCVFSAAGCTGLEGTESGEPSEGQLVSIPWTLEGFGGEHRVRISYEDSNTPGCTRVERISAVEDSAVVTIAVYARPGAASGCEQEQVTVFRDIRLKNPREGRPIVPALVPGEAQPSE